jgi:hypothetical protein
VQEGEDNEAIWRGHGRKSGVRCGEDFTFHSVYFQRNVLQIVHGTLVIIKEEWRGETTRGGKEGRKEGRQVR